MSVCPTCNGTGTTEAMACPGFRRITLPCPRCAATGDITEERAAELAAAERLRRDRLDRGLTLRQEAARLGISAPELSRMENAR